MKPVRLHARRLILLLALFACHGDPMGPGAVSVVVDGAAPNTVLVGAPGEAVPDITIHVIDGDGVPIPGASVEWIAIGRGAQLVAPWLETDEAGAARAGWTLGTDAGETQELQIFVRMPGSEGRATLQARAVPHLVSELRVALDTPAVLRLGDTLPVRINAVDPYGNVFLAPDVAVSLEDSSIGAVVGASVIGAGRGRSKVHVASNGIAAEFPIHVTQFVAAIVPASDTISFTAVGAERPVVYTVRDDRGRVIADTAATIAIVDTTKVAVTNGQVRSLAPGATELRLAIGSAAATIVVGVRQRVTSLTLDTVRFDALLDTATVHPIARDSLNVEVLQPSLSYEVTNAGVARFISGRTLTALAPGMTVLTVRDSATGITATADVVVQQRVASVTLPVAQVRFDAIADTAGVGVATARDRLGSVVTGAQIDYAVNDSTIAALLPDGRLRSVGPGQALLTARDPKTGVTGQALVVVDQVPAALAVAVDSGKPIVTLPAGATLPLACQAFDRNGHAIVQHAMVVGSVRGTVTGGGCGDTRIARSGYDTLVFTLGAAQARVPVIVSTGDSVGLAGAAHPLALSHGFTSIVQPLDPRVTFTGEDLTNPLILALRPLVNDILAAYGNPTSNLDRARALRDWLARTAVHPYPPLHPNGSTGNLGVLPPGMSWADVNALSSTRPRSDSVVAASYAYWLGVGYDGYAMLNRLLGTLDPVTGSRANDGMMAHVGGARYQIRDIQSYHYVFCTFQAIMLDALWEAAGLHGMLISTVGHDPNSVFIPELGQWVYEDPTFNEEYLLDGAGDPLSPADLLAISSAGRGSHLQATKLHGPSFDPQTYISASYVGSGHPDGMVIMGSQLNNRVVGIGGWPVRLVQIDVPQLDQYAPFNNPVSYVRVSATVAFPRLGVAVQPLQVEDSVYLAPLSSTFPNHQRFERRVSGGAWKPAADVDVLPVGQCRVEYRSVDAGGNISATAVVDVWAPRARGFVESGLPGSARARAQYCS